MRSGTHVTNLYVKLQLRQMKLQCVVYLLRGNRELHFHVNEQAHDLDMNNACQGEGEVSGEDCTSLACVIMCTEDEGQGLSEWIHTVREERVFLMHRPPGNNTKSCAST